MRLPKTFFVCLCVIGVTQMVWGQHRAGALPEHQVHARVQSSASQGEITPAVTEVAGKFNINLTITVSSSFPSGAVIMCYGRVYVEGDSNSYPSESVEAVGSTPVNGTSTCNMTMPYAWFLATASTDQLYYYYGAYLEQNVPVGSAPNIVYLRETYADPGTSIAVPANGAITTFLETMRL